MDLKIPASPSVRQSARGAPAADPELRRLLADTLSHGVSETVRRQHVRRRQRQHQQPSRAGEATADECGGARVGQLLLAQVQLLTTLKVGVLEAADGARAAAAAAAAIASKPTSVTGASASGARAQSLSETAAQQAERAGVLCEATEALLRSHLDGFDLDCAVTTFTEITRQFVSPMLPGERPASFPSSSSSSSSSSFSARSENAFGACEATLMPAYHNQLLESLGLGKGSVDSEPDASLSHLDDSPTFDCSLGTRPPPPTLASPAPPYAHDPALGQPSRPGTFARGGRHGANQVASLRSNTSSSSSHAANARRDRRMGRNNSDSHRSLQHPDSRAESSSSSTSRLGFQAARSTVSNHRRGNYNNNENGSRNKVGGANANGASKTLGMKRKFKPPRMGGGGHNDGGGYQQRGGGRSTRQRGRPGGGWNNGGVSGAINAANRMNSDARGGRDDYGDASGEEEVPERLKGIDPKLIESIENDIIGSRVNVKWEDIAGLEFAKRTCQEIVVLPIISPHLFSGLRRLPKGLLLFGPPGTGKTMIGKAIASQSGATFFSISASSLTSKWIGQVSFLCTLIVTVEGKFFLPVTGGPGGGVAADFLFEVFL